MKALILLSTLVVCAGCGRAPPQSQKAADPTAVARAADARAAADEIFARMPAKEGTAFEQKVDQSILEQMNGTAVACGTTLLATKEPKPEDRSYYVERSATAEQLRCVQSRFPFVKAQA